MTTDEFTRASIDHPVRNEDAYLVYAGDGTVAPVFAVIDGMGGHQHTTNTGSLISGRDASQMVRTVLMEDLARLPKDISAERGGDAEKKVVAALRRANERIYRGINGDGDLPIQQCVGAVATVVVVCENGQRLLVGQVGDTRAYLYSAGELFQLCEDDDNIRLLIDNGLLSEEDGQVISEVLNTFDGVNEPKVTGKVRIHGQSYDLYQAWRWFLTGNSALHIPGSNVVINALGIEPECADPQTSRIELSQNDVLLLCSDGIYKNLTEAELAHSIESSHDHANACGKAATHRSMDTVNRRSTVDDITAVTVRFE